METRAREFDLHRAHLRAVALRTLGSASEAEDAVQETWLKLAGADASRIENLGGWLTTTVARVCIDMLRARNSRQATAQASAEPRAKDEATPEHRLSVAESVGAALRLVLDALSPEERVAFVLHEVFELPFEAIGAILERTPDASRKLASRARLRIRGGAKASVDAEEGQQLVEAFLVAAAEGDLTRLVALLAPDVVLRADALAVRTAAERAARGAPALAAEIFGARKVAEAFAGRARAAVSARVGGAAGAVWKVDGIVRSAFLFETRDGSISAIELVMEPARLRSLDF